MTIKQKAREIACAAYDNIYVRRPHNDIIIRQGADIIYLSPEAERIVLANREEAVEE